MVKPLIKIIFGNLIINDFQLFQVQTANQYKFLYSTMAEYLEQRNESVIYETTKIYM